MMVQLLILLSIGCVLSAKNGTNHTTHVKHFQQYTNITPSVVLW